MSGLIGRIKNDAKKSGANKSKLLYVRDGMKVRIRFLQELDDGLEVVMHDSFERGINVVCKEAIGKHCNYCGDDTLRTRSNYAWSVWDYESNEVKILMYAVNNCSPIPALLALNETYGTIMDRDYVISVHGKQQSKQFSVVPLDKVKFRNEKAKPLSQKAVWDILLKAFPDDNDTDNSPAKTAIAKDNEENEWAEQVNDDENVYESMSPKELYHECKERNIECKPKMAAKYYINLLEEDDKANDDWGGEDDEDEEDDWEEE